MRPHVSVCLCLIVGSAIVGSLAPVVAVAPVSGVEGAVEQSDVDAVAVALAVAAGLVGDNSKRLELRAGPSRLVLDDLDVRDVVVTAHNGLTNVYIQQQLNGVDIFGAMVNVGVAENGRVFSAASRFVSAVETDAVPQFNAIQAAGLAAVAIGLEPTSPFEVLEGAVGAAQAQVLSDGGVSLAAIPARLVYQQVNEKFLRLAWEVTIETPDGQNWWQIRIDAVTGDEIDRNNQIVHENFGARPGRQLRHFPAALAQYSAPAIANDFVDGSSYKVYPQPVEAPTFSTPLPPADGRTTVVDPSDTLASPFGWHDTNGEVGAESQLTKGNNVSAYTDTDDNNVIDPGSQPDGGPGLDFAFPMDLTQAPSTYRPAAVTNLFYWNNIIHDFLYAYGFDEAAGNFQVNNYGKGGLGGDAVLAEAQDGGGTNNANFGTPPDGNAPRMQMYVWTNPNPDRDGDLDNGIVLHEYGHGLSNRLTGGPSTVACLSNTEQAGEGWSDYLSLVATMQTGDSGPQARGIGTYAFNQPTTGNGIREFPYSTDLAVDPRTYDTIKTASVPHGLGSTFAAMLWEMTWALIDQHGFDADLARGTGGNNIATQLVIDGMKLQPCSPGFVDARDAILLADQANNGGVNACIIWTAFAKRGLGTSADQGSSSSRSDGTEAFDTPATCDPLGLTKTVNSSTVEAGNEITYTLTVTNNDIDVAQTGVVVTDTIPATTTYVAGSATGCSESSGTVTLSAASLKPAASLVCTFSVLTAPSPFSTNTLGSGGEFEPDASAWTISHGAGAIDWLLATDFPSTGANAMFAENTAVVTDQYLATTAAVPMTASSTLSFWHRYDLEDRYDGGVVEISTDGGTAWTDLGPQITQNGYDSLISGGYSNPIGLRSAFSGRQLTYRETIVDLSSFDGISAHFRFRLATDTSVSNVGWWVDDVSIGSTVTVTNTATATSDQGYSATSQPAVSTVIAAATAPGVPTGVVGVAGDGQVSVSWTAPTSQGGTTITGYTVRSSDSDVETCETSLVSCVVTGLTNGTSYTFTVTATNSAGTSTASDPSDSVTPATAPSVPTGVVGVAGDGQVSVSWTAPTSQGGTTITGYTVRSSPGSQTCETAALSCTVTGLTNGTAHTFTVTATNARGNSPASLPSAPVAPVPSFVALESGRVLESRAGAASTIDGLFWQIGKRRAGSITELKVNGRGGVAADADAVVLNVTVTDPERAGYLTVYPCGATRPLASNLNYDSVGQTISNTVIVKVGVGGKVCIFTSGSTHLIADTNGYVPAG